MSNRKLPLSFYHQTDVVEISRQLVGRVLCTKIGDSPLTSGIIVETEAYCGRNDKACHANNSRTERTEIMYHEGGVAYIYLCYGIHHLFNVVTNREGLADAVLVRAVEPLDGTGTMLQRRNAENVGPSLTAGPGRLTQALGISTDFYGTDLTGNTIWIEDRNINIEKNRITAAPRIGVDYAGEHAKRPWRFYLNNNKWVSK